MLIAGDHQTDEKIDIHPKCLNAADLLLRFAVCFGNHIGYPCEAMRKFSPFIMIRELKYVHGLALRLSFAPRVT